jgi:type VI secretion system secreted protein VgrG
VTNTGPTTVGGDLGVFPGTAITDDDPPNLIVTGATYAGDAVAEQAQIDALAAYIDLAGQACDDNLTGQDLGSMTLTPGVYCFDTSAGLTGALTLDGGGVLDAVFVFKIGSTLTTASNASVVMTNGANQCNVYWQVGTSATLGTDTAFAGSIVADASISLTTGAEVIGRVLALNGAVTMDTNDISYDLCLSAPITPTVTPIVTPTEPVTPTATAIATETSVPTTEPTSAPATEAPTTTPLSPTAEAVQALLPAAGAAGAASGNLGGVIAGAAAGLSAVAIWLSRKNQR